MWKEKQYELKNWHRVIHTTWNPGGPGVVRIHMIPPKFHPFAMIPSIVIINGQEYVPLGEAWGILLTEFVDRVNDYGEREMSQETLEEILEETFYGVQHIYPSVESSRLREDLSIMTETFADLAMGRTPQAQIGQLSIGEYGKYMTAPHRMDLMVSAMTRKGSWHCNQKCIHCYAAGQPRGEEEELTTGDWKRILGILKKARIPQVTFTGGEPTLRKDLCELIGEARWFITRLNTNGILLTREYCQELVKAELDSVQITFYSCDPQIHNTLVGGEHFKETTAGIRNALEAGLSVSINTPLCTLNRDYEKTLEYLHNLGVIFVTCSGLIVTGKAREAESQKLQLTSKDLYETLKSAVAYCHSQDMEITFTSPGWLPEKQLLGLGLNPPVCGAALSNMAVTPSGEVVPCQSDLSGESLGNILQTPFRKIWNSPACRKRRAFSMEMNQSCPLHPKGEREQGRRTI